MNTCNTEKPIPNQLLVALINKNIIRQGTELLIPRSGKDLSGGKCKPFDHLVEVETFDIVDDIGICKARSIVDKKRFVVKANHIFRIDGMDPARIAKSFGLKIDGGLLSAGKKRGRKPKNRN